MFHLSGSTFGQLGELVRQTALCALPLAPQPHQERLSSQNPPTQGQLLTEALTCPEAEVLIILGTKLLQQGEEEYTEGVLDPKHRAVTPHGGKHDQPPPAALWVHEVIRVDSWNRALLRDAHLAVGVALFLSLRGVTSGHLVVPGGVNSPFCHLCVTLELLGGLELCVDWVSVTHSPK